MAKRGKARMLKNGRDDKTARFMGLPHKVMLSAAYCALTPNAKAMLCQLSMIENGRNNGSLYLSVRDAAARCGMMDLKSASRALADLQELGLIVMTGEAHFSVKTAETSRARTWRLTWRPVPGKSGATDDYLTCQPQPGTPAHRRMTAALKAHKAYTRGLASNKFAVVVSSTTKPFSAESAV